MALEPAEVEAPTRVEYVCPMHPEIVRDAPGPRPIGMALEPRTLTVESTNPELADMSRRFRISLALTVPVLLLAMSDLLPGAPVHPALGERTCSPGSSSRWRRR